MDNFNDVTTTGKSTIRLFVFERYKIVCAALLVLTLVVIGLIIGIVVISTTRKGGFPCAQPQTCTEPNCIHTASTVLRQINESFDPCDDFYGFVCHNWMEENQLPEGSSSWSPIHLMQEKVNSDAIDVLEDWDDNDPDFAKYVRIFYQSCTNTTAIEKFNMAEIVPVVKALGGWPVFDPTWNNLTYNWIPPAATSTLWLPRQARIFTPRGYLVGVKADRDITNNSKYILYVGFSQDMFDPFFNLFNNDTVLYAHFATAVLQRLGADPSRALSDMIKVAQFEQKLVQMGQNLAKTLKNVPKEFQEDIFSASLEGKHMNEDTMNEQLKKMTVSQMKTNLGEAIDWKSFINTVLSTVSTTVDDVTEVRVAFPTIMKSLNDLFKDTPKRTIANYLMWRLLTGNFFDALPDFLEDLVYPNQAKGCRETIEARSQHCLQKANVYMGKQVGRLYIDQHLDLHARSDVLDLKDKIRASLKTMMQEADWMDETTREKAITKLKEVTFSVGYSDDLMDDNLLNQLTGKGPIDPERYVFNKIRSAHDSNVLWLTQYKHNGGILDKIRSLMNPTEVNAVYYSLRNWIEVNAAFLIPPAYDFQYNDALKYGITGFMIGHELTHGFDSNGRKFDKYGNLRDWWTAKSTSNFNTRARCLVDQYNNYRIEEVDENVDGHLTLGENIADNGGVKAAFKAYQLRNQQQGLEKRLVGLERYSPEQLFFISYARFFCNNITPDGVLHQLSTDNHSPDHIRVIGPLSNFDEFSKAYKCSAGSRYNPAKKCAVW